MIDLSNQQPVAHCKTVGEIKKALRYMSKDLPVLSLEFGELIACVNIFYAKDNNTDTPVIVF